MSTIVENKKWWTNFLTPQVVIAITSVVVGAAMFYVTQKNTTKDVEVIKEQMTTKSDIKTTDALDSRVGRIYEQMNKLADKINANERQQEYERGYQDGIKGIRTK